MLRAGINFDGLSRTFSDAVRAPDRRLLASGFNMLGWVVPGAGWVRENELHITGAGIVVGTDDARIESNNIAALSAGKGTDGIIHARFLTTGWTVAGAEQRSWLASNGIHVQNCIVHSR